MGSRYMMLSSELIISTASSNSCALSTAPRPRYHLLHMPPKGGKPMMLKVPMKKATKVTGMARPSPFSSLTFFLWLATKMAPAPKKRVILAKACIAICMEAPISPALLANMAPSTM